jgi:hypothetical protein
MGSSELDCASCHDSKTRGGLAGTNIQHEAALRLSVHPLPQPLALRSLN